MRLLFARSSVRAGGGRHAFIVCSISCAATGPPIKLYLPSRPMNWHEESLAAARHCRSSALRNVIWLNSLRWPPALKDATARRERRWWPGEDQ